MKATPDTITEVRVFLTATEIGKALANRCDDEQVDALRAWVSGLFAEAMMSDKAIDFLRTILSSLASSAEDLRKAATVEDGEVKAGK